MARKHKRYRTSGVDAEGDLHSFETNSRERAHEMAKMMREELRDVEVARLRRLDVERSLSG